VLVEVGRDQVRRGESWAAAADRLVPADRQAHGPVLAVDLSGDPLVFAVDADHYFAVRAMTPGDFPDVSRWVNESHVARWWDDHRSPEQVVDHYGPAVRGEEPTRMWVWEVNGRSVGFAQDYRIGDHPEYALLSSRPDAVGVDYAVGEPAFVGRGLGTSLLWVFLRDIVGPAYPDVGEIFAAPDHRNAASLRVLAKLGFRQGLWFDEPGPDGRVDTVIGCSLDVGQVIGRGQVTRE
jgi:RimJ/RimL family protein N-acetyltransferase